MLVCFLAACEHTPDVGPEPLAGFFERVTALVTTTVRGQLRDNPPKQTLLVAQLPSFEKIATMNQLMDELKGIDPFKNLGYLIEMDICLNFRNRNIIMKEVISTPLKSNAKSSLPSLPE
jgi:hypothetical protein